ncbi:MAG: type II toxin-antitoxin system RelE/ParE family toxin [bacterium]|nr:type II toxin-antitoxin system RelE/ParE family toxin [bacterium]
MRLYAFHPAALLEAEHAAHFYEEQQAELGKRFIEALSDALTRVRRSPGMYRKIKGSVRKCRVMHFPYGLIFRENNNCIEVLAVMHLRRQPGYWEKRV